MGITMTLCAIFCGIVAIVTKDKGMRAWFTFWAVANAIGAMVAMGNGDYNKWKPNNGEYRYEENYRYRHR